MNNDVNLEEDVLNLGDKVFSLVALICLLIAIQFLLWKHFGIEAEKAARTD